MISDCGDTVTVLVTAERGSSANLVEVEEELSHATRNKG